MKVVIQRVGQASVSVETEKYFQTIGRGFVILLGVTHSDTENDVDFLVKKCSQLRIFGDLNGKMNLSLSEVDGEVLIISQFTLYGDARKGNRPNYTESAKQELAFDLYKSFVGKMKKAIIPERVKEGMFGEMMKVNICNDGPVTIIIDSKQ